MIDPDAKTWDLTFPGWRESCPTCGDRPDEVRLNGARIMHHPDATYAVYLRWKAERKGFTLSAESRTFLPCGHTVPECS